MSNVLIYTSPARGHLFPALGIATELERRGHRIHVRTLSTELSRVRALGMEATAIAEAIEARQMDDWRASHPHGALRRSVQTFVDRAEHEIEDLQSAIASCTPDVLVIDCNCWGAQAVAESSGLPWCVFQPYFTPLPSVHVPPFGPGLPLARGWLGRMRDRMLRPLIEGSLTRLAIPRVNALRARLDLDPLADMAALLRRPPRTIYFTAEPLEYPRPDWPASYRLVGPAAWGPPEPPPAWLDSIQRPIVLVTCSTEKQRDRAIVDVSLEALADEDVFVVATTGADDTGDVPSVPNVRVERFVPHDAILGRAVAVVCHGGMGITQKALAKGVPACVVPFGRDQLEVARRVEHASAGVRLPPRKLNAASLRAAVRKARTMKPGAERVAAAFRRAGGESAAADVVEQLAGHDPRRRQSAVRAPLGATHSAILPSM
jgi:MGT family glycosyltransferase